MCIISHVLVHKFAIIRRNRGVNLFKEPHIGHLYTILVADAIKRYQLLLRGSNVLLSTGTDEHGLKVQRVAEKNGLEPIELCNRTSKRFSELCGRFHVANDCFLRTSDSKHRQTVERFWNLIYSNGFIYKDVYKGWYCPADEAFVTDSNVEKIVNKNGEEIRVSIESGNPVEWCEEENYKFALSKFKNQLINWLENDSERVKPKMFYNFLLASLKNDLNDLSVSRPKSRIHWGIEVPGDSSQTIYVWMDALVNYITFSGYLTDEDSCWPPDCHVIGKDIIKFHGIYWPAFLLAAGVDLPKRIVCHSHWTVDDVKMSKSIGNVVDPFEMANKYTPEGLRYYLLRQGVPHSDTSFNEVQLKLYLNSELADIFGNLLNRCSASAINRLQIYPSTPKLELVDDEIFRELTEELEALPSKCQLFYNDANFYLGIDEIMKCLRIVNKLVQEHKPWELVKSEEQSEKLNSVIYCAFETLRICSLLLQPIVPVLSDKVLTKLNIPEYERNWNHIQPLFNSVNEREERKLNEGKFIVFQKLK